MVKAIKSRSIMIRTVFNDAVKTALHNITSYSTDFATVLPLFHLNWIDRVTVFEFLLFTFLTHFYNIFRVSVWHVRCTFQIILNCLHINFAGLTHFKFCSKIYEFHFHNTYTHLTNWFLAHDIHQYIPAFVLHN